MQGPVETEVKIRVSDREGITGKLLELGFSESVERVFEANTLYDTRLNSLRRAGGILRLRQAGERHTMTYKGSEQGGAHKRREELETGVDSGEAAHAILERIGYRPIFRYEKFRTEYKASKDDAGVVTFDQTPIGDFLELEGPGDWIDSVAKRLGFTSADYVLDSYGKLYIADCERRGIEPTNMVFRS